MSSSSLSSSSGTSPYSSWSGSLSLSSPSPSPSTSLKSSRSLPGADALLLSESLLAVPVLFSVLPCRSGRNGTDLESVPGAIGMGVSSQGACWPRSVVGWMGARVHWTLNCASASHILETQFRRALESVAIVDEKILYKSIVAMFSESAGRWSDSITRCNRAELGNLA